MIFFFSVALTSEESDGRQENVVHDGYVLEKLMDDLWVYSANSGTSEW